MKHLLWIGVLVSSVAFGQGDTLRFNLTAAHVDTQMFAMDGVWEVTDADRPTKSKDIWELKPDGIFNELKPTKDGSTELEPDETGTWILKDSHLTITVTGEDGKDYPKPFIWIFKVEESKYDHKLIQQLDSDEGNLPRRTYLMLRK